MPPNDPENEQSWKKETLEEEAAWLIAYIKWIWANRDGTQYPQMAYRYRGPGKNYDEQRRFAVNLPMLFELIEKHIQLPVPPQLAKLEAIVKREEGHTDVHDQD